MTHSAPHSHPHAPQAAPGPPLLELRGITYAYPGRTPVLDGLDFAFPPGRRLGLIGPNGAGKTTLAHAALGLLTPSAGQVLFQGRPMLCEKDFIAVRRAVGLLFQNPDDQLFYPTVLEDVAFGPLNLGLAPDQALAVSRQTLAELGLDGFEERITHRLSGGEKKLVSLAAVLAMRPQALILDEPTNALDVDTRERLVDILNRLPLSLMVISHDYDFLARTTKHIYSMRQGRISYDCLTEAHEHLHAHTHGGVPHVHGD